MVFVAIPDSLGFFRRQHWSSGEESFQIGVNSQLKEELYSKADVIFDEG
jgi:hypothetical protein